MCIHQLRVRNPVLQINSYRILIDYLEKIDPSFVHNLNSERAEESAVDKEFR
jgi:hypothetical protein